MAWPFLTEIKVVSTVSEHHMGRVWVNVPRMYVDVGCVAGVEGCQEAFPEGGASADASLAAGTNASKSAECDDHPGEAQSS